jgi:hypothetical protein
MCFLITNQFCSQSQALSLTWPLTFGVTVLKTLVQLEERTECGKPNAIGTKDCHVEIHSMWNFLIGEAKNWTKKEPKN